VKEVVALHTSIALTHYRHVRHARERAYKKGNSDTVSYNVISSSTRVNLGEGFAYLFNGEDNSITVTFKLYYGRLELFYKVCQMLGWMVLFL
jgi:hypothetical protein